jgi:hypothetical protein
MFQPQELKFRAWFQAFVKVLFALMTKASEPKLVSTIKMLKRALDFRRLTMLRHTNLVLSSAAAAALSLILAGCAGGGLNAGTGAGGGAGVTGARTGHQLQRQLTSAEGRS